MPKPDPLIFVMNFVLALPSWNKLALGFLPILWAHYLAQFDILDDEFQACDAHILPLQRPLLAHLLENYYAFPH